MVVVMAAGLIFMSIKTSQKYKFRKSAKEIHTQLLNEDHLMDPVTALDLISKKDENYIFVDIRNPRDFDNFHIEGAVNVPLQRALDDAFIPQLKNGKIKVLYSEESVEAEQVRLLLAQYGYDNLFVLQGGAKYWKENMLTKDVFKAKSDYDDEKLKFDPKKLSASN